MTKNKILVTGANGQLGSEIRELSVNQADFDFIFTDIEELDILNLQDIKNFAEQNIIASIINCAAYTAVDKAEEDQTSAYNINVSGVENLKNVAKMLQIPFIHISTDYVFDGKNYKPYVETDATNPQSVYGRTKLEGEQKALEYTKTVIVRTAWLYSSYGNNFVKTILRIATENSQIKVVFDQVGSPTYARDLASAVLQINKEILLEDNTNFGIYHYSNEGVCSWYDFSKQIIDYKGITCDVVPVLSEEFKRPAPRPYYSVLDKSKIKKNFKISIPHWTDSLKQCLDLLGKNQ